MSGVLSGVRRELYIYWRVAPAQMGQAAAAVQAWQASLALAHPGLQARLLSRCDSDEPQATLMETYAAAAGLSVALQRDIVEQGAQVTEPWRQGLRHAEIFASMGV